jgi:hypothetical protein
MQMQDEAVSFLAFVTEHKVDKPLTINNEITWLESIKDVLDELNTM